MFVVSALAGVVLMMTVPILMAILIWQLRARRSRAGVALVALVLLWLVDSREFLYLLGIPPYDPYDPYAPFGPIRSMIRSLEWFRLEIQLLATVASAVLVWPLPEPRWQRLLAIAVPVMLGLSVLVTLAFQGLDMR